MPFGFWQITESIENMAFQIMFAKNRIHIKTGMYLSETI